MAINEKMSDIWGDFLSNLFGISPAQKYIANETFNGIGSYIADKFNVQTTSTLNFNGQPLNFNITPTLPKPNLPTPLATATGFLSGLGTSAILILVVLGYMLFKGNLKLGL